VSQQLAVDSSGTIAPQEVASSPETATSVPNADWDGKHCAKSQQSSEGGGGWRSYLRSGASSRACDDEAAGTDAMPVVVVCYGGFMPDSSRHICRADPPHEQCGRSPFSLRLKAALRTSHHALANAEVQHVSSETEWTARESHSLQTLRLLLSREAEARGGRPVDLVIMQAGAATSKRGDETPEQIVEHMWSPHALAHSLGVTTLAVGNPTGFGVRAHRSTEWMASSGDLNALLRARCAATAPKCSFVEAPGSWRRVPQYWESDGSRMSGAGYAALGHAVAPAALDAVTGPRQLRRAR